MILCWCWKKKKKERASSCDEKDVTPTAAVTNTTTELIDTVIDRPQSPNPLDSLAVDDIELGNTLKGVSLGDTVVLGDSGEVAVLVEDLGEELCPRYCVRNAEGESKWVSSVVLAELEDIIPDEAPGPCIQTSPARKSVRLCFEDTVATPGDYHKAPVGAAVQVLAHGEWTPAVVTELHSDGLSDIIWQSGAVQYKVRPEFIRLANANYSSNCVQGRWYDGTGRTYDVANLSVKCVLPSGITVLTNLISRNGMILNEGIKAYRISNEMIVWADTSVWRRVQGTHVSFDVNDMSVQWGQSALGLVIQANNGSTDLSVGQVLHSIDDKCVMTLDQFTQHVVHSNKQVLKLLMCPPAPHHPIPAPYFDSTALKPNQEVSAVWGGMYHLCTILGKASNEGYIIRWTFDHSNWTAIPLALKEPEAADDPRAEAVADCWVKGKKLFNMIVSHYQDTSNGTCQSAVKRADMMCALRLTRASAKVYLRGLPNETVTLTEWLVWVGRLCELSIGAQYLEWVNSHLTAAEPLPPPEMVKGRLAEHEQCDAYPSMTPPVEDCVLIVPGRGKVVGESGTVARIGETFDTDEVGTLAPGTLVDVSEVRGRRAMVVAPLVGWVSLITADGQMLVAEAQASGTEDEEVVLKEHRAPLGCVFDDAAVLINVDSTGPAKRACLERFIGRTVECVNDVRVNTGSDVRRHTRSATQVQLRFKPVKKEVRELRKRDDEETGLIFSDTALTGVVPLSAGERCGFSEFVGRYILSLGDEVVRSEPDMDLLCGGATNVRLVFREVLPTDPTPPLAGLMEEADSDSDTSQSPSPILKSPHTPF